MNFSMLNKFEMLLTVLAGAFAVVAILLSEAAQDVNAAFAEADRWRHVIVSNKSFLFFFNLVIVGIAGGAIGSRFKHRKRVRFGIMIATWGVIWLVGFATFGVTPVPVGN